MITKHPPPLPLPEGWANVAWEVVVEPPDRVGLLLLNDNRDILHRGPAIGMAGKDGVGRTVRALRELATEINDWLGSVAALRTMLGGIEVRMAHLGNMSRANVNGKVAGDGGSVSPVAKGRL